MAEERKRRRVEIKQEKERRGEDRRREEKIGRA